MTDLEICKDIAADIQRLRENADRQPWDRLAPAIIGSLMASVMTLAEIVERQLKATEAGH